MITDKSILSKININTNSKIQKLTKNNTNNFYIYLPRDILNFIINPKNL